MKNPTKDLFNFLKGIGKYPQYKNYEEYRRKTFLIDEEPTESFKEFWESLSEKDKEDYNKMFN